MAWKLINKTQVLNEIKFFFWTNGDSIASYADKARSNKQVKHRYKMFQKERQGVVCGSGHERKYVVTC